MNRDRGFVLVNALILVGVLAAVAAVLLQRAQQAHLRAGLGQEAAQAALYLDAYESLAITLLERDRTGPSVDHLGEAWADDIAALPLDRGRVSGRIGDLLGRFNLSLLRNPGDLLAQQRFEALTEEISLPADAGARILQSLRADPGPTVIEQIAPAAGLSASQAAALAQVAALLPQAQGLNVNTAPRAVLVAHFPQAGSTDIDALLARRAEGPLRSHEAFAGAVAETLGPDAASGIDGTYYTVRSQWFELWAEAELGDARLDRRTVLTRDPPARGTRVHHRIGGGI